MAVGSSWQKGCELYVMASDMPIVQAAALVNALFTLLRM
eukprot:SAG31_NODE_43676_length_266_cov_0.616766_1_plen_38_part_01